MPRLIVPIKELMNMDEECILNMLDTAGFNLEKSIKQSKSDGNITYIQEEPHETILMNIIDKMVAELNRADKKYAHDTMSPKEIEASFLTLKCEVMELEREISRKNRNVLYLQKEAIQVLAMAMKFCRDVAFSEEL